MLNFFKAIFNAVFSRYTLALLVLVGGGLALWFLGPLVSFGGLHPLQGLGMRVTALVMLLALLLFLLLGWSTIVLGVVALCVLIWHAGPLLAVGDAAPLSPVWVRAAIIGGVLLVYAVYGLARLWSAMRTNPDLLNRYLHPDRNKPQNTAREELKTLAGIVRQAVDQLRHMRLGSSGGGVRRVVEGRRYLYELPWYMIIGVPGAGKTTALLNSGCKFPIADQMGSASAQMALASNAGTTNSNWWFTNDAVLIDTAGRYTAQDDGASALVRRSNGSAAEHEGTASDARSSSGSGTPELKNSAEWLGYLGLLRKHRPRAPINGALLTIDVADLVAQSPAQRTAQAAALRARLAELRRELGVRFPVYVLVTKCDLLRGFTDYFSALTSEGRSQVWGFTLPWNSDASRAGAASKLSPQRAADDPEGAAQHSLLGAAIANELDGLRARLDDAMPARLQEEFDLPRRQRLYALPQEFGAIARPLTDLLEEVFLESRFDATQLTHSLRGVYFTSALQGDRHVVAEPHTLMARLSRALAVQGKASPPQATTGNRSYFLHDVMSRIVFKEGHLVRPNLGWEFRFRMLRWLGHAIVLIVFGWLASALLVSYGNNQRYLADTGNKASALADQVTSLFARFKIDGVPDTLQAAQDLPVHRGLDLADPMASYTYGLYTPPPIVSASADTYAHLQDQMLVPQMARRMENVLSRALVDHDEKLAYQTLRVYLMLHDKQHFNAEEMKAWVLRDWQSAEGGKVLGTQASMLPHLESLFSGGRVVQSPLVQNEGLVKRARAFLDGTASSERLYERAKAALLQDAPPDFTLLRVVGAQAGTVFSRASGEPLEKGVPGLYTYDGYHELFSKRLPELVAKAQEEDAWVMGQDGRWGAAGSVQATLGAAGKKTVDAAAQLLKVEPLMEDIRRRYLTEYTQHWTAFLDDIRPVTGTTLAFDLTMLRQFAAPDSPLSRLARAATRETTLSRQLNVVPDEDKSYFDKASDQLNKQATAIKKNLGLRPEARIEKQLVDSRFAALREVVTGQSDSAFYGAGSSRGGSNFLSGGIRSSLNSGLNNSVNATLNGAGSPSAYTGGRPALENVTAMINEFYTTLAVAETALAANSMPQLNGDPGAKMRLEGARLPAPLQQVLLGLATSGSQKITQGASDILRGQATQQMDRLLGLMTAQVTEVCKRGIEGRYPFVAASASGTAQEVQIEDFNALFASGGVADEYFAKYLAPYVDTSLRPWRYKSPGTPNLATPMDSLGTAPPPSTTGPTLTGELLKLLAQRGPNPDAFAQVAQIRDVFFREAGGKRMQWKMDVKVLELDPTINELVINLDGQGQRYVHGPVQAIPINWPGPRGGAQAELTATPRIRPDTSSIITSGPWALLRLMERGRVIDSATVGRASVEFMFDGRRTVLDVNTGRLANPMTTDLLRTFKCPGSA